MGRLGVLSSLVLVFLLAACGGDAFPTPDRNQAAAPTVATTPVGGVLLTGERVGKDQTGACQITVPAGFAGDSAFWHDADASIILSAETIKSGDFAAYAAAIPKNVASNPGVKDYQQGQIQQEANSYLLHYTTDANPGDALYGKKTTGLFVARLVRDTVVCSLLFAYPTGSETQYDPIRDAVVNSLQGIGP
jgi:hypothetical protein